MAPIHYRSPDQFFLVPKQHIQDSIAPSGSIQHLCYPDTLQKSP